MSSYNIGRYKVYLSHDRYKKINHLALAHKDARFRIGSLIDGHPQSLEAHQLRFQYLSNLCQQNQEVFFREWVEFNLRGREAQENAWDLLSDYCHVSQIGYVADLRTEFDAILSDLGDNHRDIWNYPMGRVFALEILGEHTIASRLRFKPQPTVTVEIDTSNVVAAYGTIEDFRLQFHHSEFHCGKLFSMQIK